MDGMVTVEAEDAKGRRLGRDELRDIATGAAILGTGGGGDPYVGRLLADVALRDGRPVRLIDLADVPDDAVVAAVGVIGAPTIGIEKVQGADEVVDAVHALDSGLSHPVTHLVCTEVGGGNSMVPIVAASKLGLPLIDADGMGRAFPELQMLTPSLLGYSATPLGLADEKGNSMVLNASDNAWAERIARQVAVSMGCTATYAMYPLDGAAARDAYIPGTLTWAGRLGALYRLSRHDHRDVPSALAEELHGIVAFTGKVVEVHRRTVGGFVRGRAHLVSMDGVDAFELDFQNENLVARHGDRVVATVPDLICVVETDGGAPVTTEDLTYGARVSVLIAPSHEKWRTPEGLALVGPRYFGYDLDFVPFEERAGRS